MIEYAKVSLLGVSLWKALFKKELEKIIEWSDEEEIDELKRYCFEKYNDMHPDVLAEVFSFKNKNLNPVRAKKSVSQYQ
jgi:hypothetical protein